MLPVTILSTTLLGLGLGLGLATAQAVVNYPEAFRSCGFKIAPCPSDQYCRPDSEDCVDLDRCQGTCVFKNAYPNCGSNGMNPQRCKLPALCVDDPRNPNSCGMACDALGICLPPKLATCGGREDKKMCEKGKWCYSYDKTDCQKDKDGKCLGVCL